MTEATEEIIKESEGKKRRHRSFTEWED